jgi:hypothetical protein
MNPSSFDYLVIKESDLKNEILDKQINNGMYLHKEHFANWKEDQTSTSTKKIFSGQTTYKLTSIDQRIPGLTTISTKSEISPIPLNVETITGDAICDKETGLTRLDLKYNVANVPAELLKSLKYLRELHISPLISQQSVGDMFTTCGDVEYKDLFGSNNRLIHGTNMVTLRDSNPLVKIIFRTPEEVNGTVYTLHEEQFTTEMNNNLYIKAAMFEGMINLKTLLLPSMIYIPPRMCRNCKSLKSIDLCNAGRYIASRAFENCTSLKAVVGNTAIEYLGECAFKNCGILTINNWYYLRTCHAEAFAECKKLKFIAFDWSRIGPAYLYFGPRVFADCTDLRAVDLTDMYIRNVDYISDIPQYNNSVVTSSLDIPTSLADYNKSFDRLFYGCENLEYVKLGRENQRIGHEMFGNCYKLASIHMPTNVEEFCSNAFLNCSNLKEITISITSHTREIGWGLFRGCSSLEVIRIDMSSIKTNADFRLIEERIHHSKVNDRYPRFRNFTGDELSHIKSQHSDVFSSFVQMIAEDNGQWIVDLLAHCQTKTGIVNVVATVGGLITDGNGNKSTITQADRPLYHASYILNGAYQHIYSSEDTDQRFALFNPHGTHYEMQIDIIA